VIFYICHADATAAHHHPDDAYGQHCVLHSGE
jgi:hypothetical protein